jgi:hypothetical protein
LALGGYQLIKVQAQFDVGENIRNSKGRQPIIYGAGHLEQKKLPWRINIV